MSIFIWVGFILFILFLLYLDLAILNRKEHAVEPREAGLLSLMWIGLSLVFNVAIFFAYENHWLGIGLDLGHIMSGKEAALNFFTGYLVEKSLSIDNLFVIAMIFAYFKISPQFQHRILFWGILGAIIFRAIMILVGATLMNTFEWITYLFGGILIFSAAKMLIARHDNIDPYQNPVVKLVKRFYLISKDENTSSFFTIENGKRAVTIPFLALIVIELTDIMFAVDSIPAIFAITTDPFLVFTSNIFAILGLRSLYFLLAAVIDRFRYLKMSLVFILAFVGVKMLLVHHFKFPVWVSLSFIIGILVVGIIASIIVGKKDTAALKPPKLKESK